MEKLKILDLIVPGYTEKFVKGQYGLEEMPLLNALCTRFQNQPLPDLQRTYVVACQHLLQPQIEMFRCFTKLGLPASHVWVLPKVYSANQSVADEIIHMGCFLETNAFAFPLGQNFDVFHALQCEKMVDKSLREIPAGSKVLILDDGGMLISSFAKNRATQTHFELYGVEQTASGKNILVGSKLPFLVTSVASSVEKIEIETDYIIRHAVKRVFEYFTEENIEKNVKILVLGKGPIGKTLVASLLAHGFLCTGYDISDKGRKPTLSEFDVVIGATGKMSVSVKDLKNLKQGCHLISVSSSDREFPSAYLRTHAIAGSAVHDTFVSSTGIRLANGGFPITFKAEQIECYPLEMDVTMMKLTEGILNHIVCETRFDESIQEIKFQKLSPWMTVNGYAFIVMIGILWVIQTVFTIIIPGQLWAHTLLASMLIWGAIPSFCFLKHYYNLSKLLPKTAPL